MGKRLVAYDADGKVIATLDVLVARDETGKAIGLVDFAAHEKAGGKLRDIWNVSGAVRSKVVNAPRKPAGKQSGTPPHLPVQKPPEPLP